MCMVRFARKCNRLVLSAILALCVVYMVVPVSASAFFGTGLEMRVGTVYCDIFKALQGRVAQGLASLAVIFLGLAAMYGKADKSMAVILIAGIAIIFGSVAIVDFVGGSAVPFLPTFIGTEESCEVAKIGGLVTDAGALGASMLEVLINGAGAGP